MAEADPEMEAGNLEKSGLVHNPHSPCFAECPALFEGNITVRASSHRQGLAEVDSKGFPIHKPAGPLQHKILVSIVLLSSLSSCLAHGLSSRILSEFDFPFECEVPELVGPPGSDLEGMIPLSPPEILECLLTMAVVAGDKRVVRIELKSVIQYRCNAFFSAYFPPERLVEAVDIHTFDYRIVNTVARFVESVKSVDPG